jgi:2-keto-4-pentenoate hydratase/2-oxohepta-3-ene-1,7-dioic acid hydratase in catechol pathway
MRFISFADGGRPGIGIATADGEFRGQLAGSDGYPGDLLHLLRAGRDGMASAHGRLRRAPVLDPERINFLPPLAAPPKIICVGLNYAAHAAESPYEVPTYPTLFARFASSMVGHRAPIVRPRVSTQLDYEGEMVVVIGRPGRHIPMQRALEHVAGYSIFNDGSLRDYQFKSPQWTVGKNFDGTGAFGPSFVTADEIPAGARGLRLQTRLNGAVMQSASTDDLLFDVQALISIISEAMTLETGDIIVSGTPAGVGAGRKPPVWMKAGDICEVEIEGLGVLSNPIVDEDRA